MTNFMECEVKYKFFKCEKIVLAATSFVFYYDCLISKCMLIYSVTLVVSC